MSTGELRRAGVLARVAAETLTLKSAAALMDVSYRQAKRLYGRYRAAGAKGLGDQDHSGELAAAERAHRAQPRHAPGSAGEGTAAQRRSGHRRRQRFSRRGYWDDHNRRFAQAPASDEDFPVAVPRGQQLDKIFRLQETRTVSNDWVIRYDNRLLQLERQSQRPPARSTGDHPWRRVDDEFRIDQQLAADRKALRR